MKIGLIASILLSTMVSFASDVVLTDISTSVKDGKSVIEYSFSDRVGPRKLALDFIKDTVQIDVPKAFLEEKKRFTNVEDEKIKNLYSYQLNKNTLRLRVNYKPGQNAAELQDAVTTVFDNNKLIVTIDDGRVPLKATTSLPEKIENIVTVESLTGEDIETPDAIVAAAEVTTETTEGLDLGMQDEEKITLSEKDIPVLQAASSKEEKKSGSFLFRAMSSFVILALFALGMFLLARKWSKTKLKNPHTHIKVLTQHYIGPKKSLAIISVAGESILIGVTENNINLIKELSLIDDEIPQHVSNNFDQTMDEANQVYEAEENLGAAEQDSFSISGIKDIVKTRLKTMREL